MDYFGMQYPDIHHNQIDYFGMAQDCRRMIDELHEFIKSSNIFGYGVSMDTYNLKEDLMQFEVYCLEQPHIIHGYME